MLVRLTLSAALAVATALTALPAQAAASSQTTPLADANLFISPSGQAYRSKPGDPYPVVAWFTHTDTNHDGKIDRAEFRAEAEEFFHQLDLRKNGVIDDEIIGLYEKRVVPEILAGVGGVLWRGGVDDAKLIKVGGQSTGGSITNPGPPADLAPAHPRADDGGPKGAAAYGLLNDAEPLRSADRNFLSKIRLADILAQADRNFDALDFEHVGYLTLDDLPRTPAQKDARVARR